ncbi:MAG TPA: hypothetical protein VE956_13570 [Nodularia sp. (in: cyanobacteria)]|nr:hypothetical protein [Nodularia sp. (in: cyanobacteria)]
MNSQDRNCTNCKHCHIWWGYTEKDICFHPECDWDSGSLLDEDGLFIGYYFDPDWSENVAADCDFYEEEE